MRFPYLVLPAALVSLGHARISERQNAEARGGEISNRYIIEYVPGANIQKRSDEDFTVVKSFESDVFNGASIVAKDMNLDQISALPYVANVWPNRRVEMAAVTLQGSADEAAAFRYDPHLTTGVSKLHDEGIFGKGAIVAIVDGGVNWTHPALGGRYGPGFKVAYGYDLAGDGAALTPFVPDNDPTAIGGHGTFVAGIVAGKNAWWSGVAPEATIYAYKCSINGASGWSSNPWAVVASRLVDQGVVVAISSGNDGEAGLAYSSNGAAGTNVLAVASVESLDAPARSFNLTFTLDHKLNTTTAGYLPSSVLGPFPATIKDWPVVTLTLDTNATDEGCTPYPAGTPRLEGKLALLRYGGCEYTVKQENIGAIGGSYFLEYNTPEHEIYFPYPVTPNGTGIGVIANGAGEAILNTLKAGGSVTADFTLTFDHVVALKYHGGLPTPGISWGPLNDLEIKPDISAPGGLIYGPWGGAGYVVVTGTSFSAPYVAGVAALYIGLYGGRKTHGAAFGKFLSRRIIASGTSLPWNNGSSPNYLPIPGFNSSIAKTGNGLVDAYKVLRYTTDLTFDKIALNDTANFRRYHDISVKNGGNQSVTYTFSGSPCGGFEAIGWFPKSGIFGGRRIRLEAEMVPQKLDPEIVFPQPFTLKAGESKTVTVSFKNPDVLGWNASNLPIYNGKVVVSGSNGEQLSVPYLGVGADLKREINPIFLDGWPISNSTNEGLDFKAKSSFTFDLSLTAQDFPKIQTALLWSTKELRWDIFEANWAEHKWRYPPVIGKNGYVGSASTWINSGLVPAFDPATQNASDTVDLPRTYVPRSGEWTVDPPIDDWWFGKLANGSQISTGNYTFRIAALRPFGNPQASDNWSIFKTPQIQILGPSKPGNGTRRRGFM